LLASDIIYHIPSASTLPFFIDYRYFAALLNPIHPTFMPYTAFTVRQSPIIAWLFLCLLFPTFSFAQDCSALIKENKKIAGTQIMNTAVLTIIVRGAYSYSINYFANEKGIFARFTSTGGIEFNQDDQVVFVDSTGVERIYKFNSMDELAPGAVPTHRNNLLLDINALKWLAESNITAINFINWVDRQKYKFTINKDRQGEFNKLTSCFYNNLDKNAIVSTGSVEIERPVVQAPSAGSKPVPGSKPTATNPAATTTPAAKPAGDPELTNLRSELEKTKEKIRTDIRLEKERGDAIKAQLASEVAAARDAANQKKTDYSNEVLEARKSSLAEIEKSKLEAQQYIAISRTKADSAVTRISLSVEEARRQAGEEIQRARVASSEEVKKARENA
jgi:hypothetical protein